MIDDLNSRVTEKRYQITHSKVVAQVTINMYKLYFSNPT